MDEIVARWRRGGRLFYFGAGTSGRLGVLDASECPPTFSSPPEQVQGTIAGGDVALRQAVEGAEDDARAGALAVQRAGAGERDVVVGLAASGSTPYVLGALGAARERGAFAVAVVCNPGSALSAAADLAIEVEVGPEVVTGSTRLKAGTAQKLVLNMLSTAAMIRSGKVYGNLMVDLTATNAKLRRRAARIVAEVAGISPAAALPLLQQTGFRVKPAIVMAVRGCDAAEATRRLEAAGGMLREALADQGRPEEGAVRRPRIVVTAGYEAMSLAGAEIVDATIRSLPGAVLALPTGGTPVGMYACLATMYRERGTDWSGVTTFNLDEYCDTGPDDPQSYAAYMERHLFAHIRIPPPQRHLPDGLAPDPEAEARRYEAEIDARGGIDLAVLGVGTNGHIGFNEPGPGLMAETHVALLADETWGRNFPDLARRAPRRAGPAPALPAGLHHGHGDDPAGAAHPPAGQRGGEAGGAEGGPGRAPDARPTRPRCSGCTREVTLVLDEAAPSETPRAPVSARLPLGGGRGYPAASTSRRSMCSGALTPIRARTLRSTCLVGRDQAQAGDRDRGGRVVRGALGRQHPAVAVEGGDAAPELQGVVGQAVRLAAAPRRRRRSPGSAGAGGPGPAPRGAPGWRGPVWPAAAQSTPRCRASSRMLAVRAWAYCT